MSRKLKRMDRRIDRQTFSPNFTIDNYLANFQTSSHPKHFQHGLLLHHMIDWKKKQQNK